VIERQEETSDAILGRIIALSDGIFAFAMTLLVVSIQLPALPEDVSSGEMALALLALWPKYEGYVISFLVIGLYWISHLHNFRYIRRSGRWLPWLTVVFLMTIAFVPFPTAVLSGYRLRDVSVAFYAASLTITGLTSWLIWWYASTEHRLVQRNLDPRQIRATSVGILITPIVFAVSIPIAFVNPQVATYFWLILFLLRPLVRRVTGVQPDQ
jgi:uncharacterized membrane protein